MWHVVPANESFSDAKTVATKQLQDVTGIIDPKTVQQSFTLPSPKRPTGVSEWTELSSEVKKVTDFRTVEWTAECEEVGKVRNGLIVLAAVKVNNEILIGQLVTESPVVDCIDKPTGDLDLNRLVCVCLEAAIGGWCEDLACDILEMLKADLPLHIVHRAGERGFVRFLKCVVKYNIPVKPNGVIAKMPFTVQRLLGRKQESKFQRFPAKQRFLTEEEVLRWAALINREEGVKSFLQSGHTLDPGKIAEVLLSEGLTELLHEVLTPHEISKLPIDCLLQHGQLRLAVSILTARKSYMTRKTPKALRSYVVISKLIAKIPDSRSSLSAIYLLMLVKKQEWNLPEVEFAFETLTNILQTENVEKTIISNHCNPLLLCVTMSELCSHVSEYSLQLRERFLQLSSDFLRLAEYIQAQYEDYRRLRVLYLEKTFGSECLFDVITKNTEKYRVLLKSDTVAAIAKDLWTGGDSVGFNFDLLSAVNEYFDECDTSIFRIHQLYAKESLPQCIFQLYYWKKNGSLRFVIETFMFVTFFGILVSQTILYLSIVSILEDPTKVSQISQAMDQMQVQGRLTNIIVACSGAVVLNVFQQMAYKSLLKEPFSFSFTDLFSVCFFASSFAVNILSQPSVSAQIDVTVNQNTMEYLYAIMMFTICLRISAILTQTRTFGPWIRMIFVIVKDILVFLVIYFLAVVSFAMTYIMLFRHDSDYFGSIQLSIRTLFQWSVGGIDSSIFTVRQELGSVLSITWAFVSTIILLNLLIAVLSSRYDELAPQVTADYVSLIYRSYTQTRYEPPYGSLVIMPAPFNVVSFPLVFVYLICPRMAVKLDRFIVVLSYQVMFFSGSILFLTYNVCAATVAYFFVFGQIMKSLTVKSAFEVVQWLFAGPPYLWYLIFISYTRFVKKMYREPEQVEDSIPSEVLLPAKKFVDKVCGQARDTVTISLTDIEIAIAKFPHRKETSIKAQSISVSKFKANDSFRQVAERIYFSKSQLSNERSRGIFEFFAQFRSYSKGNSFPTINLTRMSHLFSAYFHRPQKLAAINVYYVQKALLKIRSEAEADDDFP